MDDASSDGGTRSAASARLDLTHDAYLTMGSLEHTQICPTAWWLPLVAGSEARLAEWA